MFVPREGTYTHLWSNTGRFPAFTRSVSSQSPAAAQPERRPAADIGGMTNARSSRGPALALLVGACGIITAAGVAVLPQHSDAPQAKGHHGGNHHYGFGPRSGHKMPDDVDVIPDAGPESTTV